MTWHSYDRRQDMLCVELTRSNIQEILSEILVNKLRIHLLTFSLLTLLPSAKLVDVNTLRYPKKYTMFSVFLRLTQHQKNLKLRRPFQLGTRNYYLQLK